MEHQERRIFLKAVGAAALSSRARPATGRIRVGIFGIQHGHLQSKLRALKQLPEFEVVAVHEPDDGLRLRRQMDGMFSGLKWVGEEALLNDSSIQMVVVEGRIWDAIPWGAKVLAAGKHLHLEKPPSPDLTPFARLVDEARRKKLLLQLGYNYRFHPCMNAALNAAREGWLGDVYLLRATMNSDRGPEQRQLEATYPGGAFFELAGHMVDRAVELFGRPNEVHSFLRHDTSIADALADNTLAVMEFDKALAVISTAARMPNSGAHRSFELIGTGGSFFIQPISGERTMRVNMRQARGPYREGWQEIKFRPHLYDVEEFKDFARAIGAGEPLKYSYDHELLVHETLLRASKHIA